jgi:hypothetical protein
MTRSYMRILLPVDDSQYSDGALKPVIARTQPKDVEIRVLYVVETPTSLVAREKGDTTPHSTMPGKRRRNRYKRL